MTTSVMVVLLILAVATPLAHGQPLVTVNGQLCCTSSGNCPPGAVPMANALVNLVCTGALGGGSATVGQGATGADGTFSINVPATITTALSTLPAILGGSQRVPCAAIVNLPLNQTVCPALSAAVGALAAPLNLVSTGISAVGNILNFMTAPFLNVNA